MFQKTTITLFSFLFLLFTEGISQNADCDKMLILKDTIYHTKAISGFGAKKEFDGNALEDKKVFEKEANSVWYLITAPETGIFTFDIVTENESDDWDFLLFEHKKMFCKRIRDKVISPIRSNLSRSPITGLSEKGTEMFVAAGVNANYSKSLKVVKGERYVLVVNNPKRAGGKHTLVLHFPKKEVVKEVIEEKPSVESVSIKLELIVKDAVSNDLIKANMVISGLDKEGLKVKDQSIYVQYLPKKRREIHVGISAKGYLLYDDMYKISAKKSVFSKDVLLQKIKVGDKVNLKRLQFHGNRADFLPGAENSLQALLSFMNQNPNVVVEVEGHVNGPKQKNSKAYKELSYSRAYAVKAFLLKNGVKDDRIDFKGYGNSQMLYPNPKSAYQESANRRVEIKILSNEYNSGN